MPVLHFLDHQPHLDGDVSIAEDAFVVGNVTLHGPAVLESSAVIRADQTSISIGPNFFMGHGSTVHVDPGKPTTIGRDVCLGVGVVVHGCTLGEGVRVEDGGLVLSGSTVAAGSIVAAGALVTEGATFPPNSYIAGSPGRQVRESTPEERAETLRRLPGA